MPSPTAANPVSQYLHTMRLAHSLGAHTAETTFYTPFANLLNTVGDGLTPRVRFQAHPGTHGAGLADGGLFSMPRSRQREPLAGQKPDRGAVELKAAGTSITALAESAQVRRYLEQYGLCLISNFHQFQLLEWRDGTTRLLERYELTPNADEFWTAPLPALVREHGQTLPDFLARVMTRKVPLERPRDVAWLLASYARDARTRAANHRLAAFAGVKAALEESLGITFQGEQGESFFLSTLIQTLFYGIFSAWVIWHRTCRERERERERERDIRDRFDWRLSATYLRLPVLRALFHSIAEPGALQALHVPESLDSAADALNRVQLAFFATFNDTDAVNYFYEPFLEAFDPELRKQLGVWYTPREIVRYMVERVDHLLRTELGEPRGLASPNVQVLDPCCGTGAYLVEVLARIHRTLREEAGDDDALVPADLRRAATTRIFGFEILPAPFVIAHLQISNLLEDAGASLAESQRAQVFLTNALTGWVPVRHPQSNFGFPAFAEERDAAERVKQADTILVILGNPPYNGYAGIAPTRTGEGGSEERDLTLAYRTPEPGLPAPQGQGLNDLYIRFFRIAERRVVGDAAVTGNATGRGLISYISNNAWLDGLSHTSMRARYLREFQHIYIDNLNGDKYRTGKTTPEGKPDPSAFSTAQNREGIQVGTAITTLVRTGPRVAPQPIHLRDLWGTHKLSHLDREAKREAEPEYRQLMPTPALGLPFASRVHSEAYISWPRLPELFPVSFPGVKTSRDPILVDIDREALIDRMAYYLDRRNTDEAVHGRMPLAMTDAHGFDAKAERHFLTQYHSTMLDADEKRSPSMAEEDRARKLVSGNLVRYYYRPFDLRWLYYQSESTLLNRPRAEYETMTRSEQPWLLTSQTNRHAFDPPCLAHALSSLHIVEKGTSAFPLFGKSSGLLADAQDWFLTLNLNRDAFPFRPNNEELDFPFFHALATMHTPRYRAENSGALLGDWPRIPLPATAEFLAHSAALGRRLAELLDPESEVELRAEWSFLARLVLPPELPEGTPDRDARNSARLAVTAGWGGAGQGSTVMPRRGDARERPWTETERSRNATLAGTLSLEPETALDLLGEHCVDVYLNANTLWAAVPVRVWEYTLGGYQVLKKWLSYREETLLHRPLREEEARYFAQVVRRISAILLLGPALDASYSAILPGATGLPNEQMLSRQLLPRAAEDNLQGIGEL